MARRTKKDAELTKERLLLKAGQLFDAGGIYSTNLETIALAAGATRGAVTWHFGDKVGLVTAIIDDLVRILSSDIDQRSIGFVAPLEALTAQWLAPMRIAAKDDRSRWAISIANRMADLPPEYGQVRERAANVVQQSIDEQTRLLRRAAASYGLKIRPTVLAGARGLQTLRNGLLLEWARQQSYDLLKVGKASLGYQLVGMGFSKNDVTEAVNFVDS